MRSIIKKEELCAYVSDSQIITFIADNAPMDFNQCCDFVRKYDIVGAEDGRAHWTKDILKCPDQYNEQQVKWISAFFEAHPFIEQFMCVFDD